MKIKTKVIWSAVLVGCFIPFFPVVDSFSASNAFKLTGLGGGYSFVLKDVRYRESDQGYFAPKMKPCLDLTLGLVTDGHIGILFDGSIHFFDEIYHNLTDVGPATTRHNSTALLNLSASLEFHVFKNLQRSWNPYFELGAFVVIPLNMHIDLINGSIPPDYPRKGEMAGLRATAGARFRMSRSIFLKPRLVYDSGISIVSFQVGVDMIFPKKSHADPPLPSGRWKVPRRRIHD